MMAASRQQPLIVEGKDDYHSILHLLKRSGVLPEESTAESSPVKFIEAGSKDELLREIGIRWKEAGVKSIGYVLDADDAASRLKGIGPTWEAIRTHLNQLGVESEAPISPAGFIAQIPSGPRIGFWIMPNNSSDGSLEDFLISQIDEEDALFQFASEKTVEVENRSIPGSFVNQDLSKAKLRCWLAWSKEPGQPFGIAMKAGRFKPVGPPATLFSDWVRKLYGI